MGRSCCVPRCVSNRRKNRNSVYRRNSTFKFPSDLPLRRQWLINIDRELYVPTENVGVCELHFEEKYICRPTVGRSTLLKNAVPMCLNPNAEPCTYNNNFTLDKNEVKSLQTTIENKKSLISDVLQSSVVIQKKPPRVVSSINEILPKNGSVNTTDENEPKMNGSTNKIASVNGTSINTKSIRLDAGKSNDDSQTYYNGFDKILSEIKDLATDGAYYIKHGNILQIFTLTDAVVPYEVAWCLHIKKDMTFSVSVNSLEKNSINNLRHDYKLTLFNDIFHQCDDTFPNTIQNPEVLKQLLNFIGYCYATVSNYT